MAVKYLAGERMIGTAAERAALTSGVSTAGCLGFWNMQQQVTVGSAQHSQTDTGAPTQIDFSDVSVVRSKINSGHADIGDTINRVDVYLGRATQSNTNGTGTLTVRFYDDSASTYITMGTLDTSLLTTESPAKYTFSAGSITLAAGDWLEVQYGSGGQGGYDFRPTVYHNNDGLGSSNETTAMRIGNTSASWSETTGGLMAWVGYNETNRTITNQATGSGFANGLGSAADGEPAGTNPSRAERTGSIWKQIVGGSDSEITSGTSSRGEKFTGVVPAGKLTKATFSIKKSGTPSGTVTCQLYNSSGTSIETAAETYNNSSLTTSFVDKTFTFDGENELTANGWVAITVTGGNGGIYLSKNIASYGTPTDVAALHYDSGSWTHETNPRSYAGEIFLEVGKFRTYAYEWKDAHSSQISVPDQNGLDITGDITITSWIYPTEGGSGGRTFFTKRTGSNANYQFYGRETGSGADNLYLAYYDNTNSSKTTTTTELTRNAWHFVAMTISSNTLKMYVDNTEQSVGSNTGLSARPANSAPLTFGSFDTSTEEYAGRMQDTTIWNRALSASEISALYASGSGYSLENGLIVPLLPNGTIFEESDTGKHYMFDGTDTWNEME